MEVYHRPMLDEGRANDEPRPSDDGLAVQPIRGGTELQLEDLKRAWLAPAHMPGAIARLVAAVLVIPTVMWSLARETAGAAVLLAIPFGLGAVAYGLGRGRTRWAQAALHGSSSVAVEYLFDDYGYQVKTPWGESRLAWEAVHAQRVSKEAFLIYMTPQLLLVVPKRAFSEADQVRLGKQLEARVPRLERGRGLLRVVGLWVMLVFAFLVIWMVWL